MRMDLKHLSPKQLIERMEILQALHTGSVDKTFIVKDKLAGDTVYLQDDRLNDLLCLLYYETYNELVDRFPMKIPTDGVYNPGPGPIPMPATQEDPGR